MWILFLSFYVGEREKMKTWKKKISKKGQENSVFLGKMNFKEK